MLIGDINAEPTEATVSDFCKIYNLKHLIKDKTCFKNPTKPTCIDLIVTNKPKCFQDTGYWNRVIRFSQDKCYSCENALYQSKAFYSLLL